MDATTRHFEKNLRRIGLRLKRWDGINNNIFPGKQQPLPLHKHNLRLPPSPSSSHFKSPSTFIFNGGGLAGLAGCAVSGGGGRLIRRQLCRGPGEDAVWSGGEEERRSVSAANWFLGGDTRSSWSNQRSRRQDGDAEFYILGHVMKSKLTTELNLLLNSISHVSNSNMMSSKVLWIHQTHSTRPFKTRRGSDSTTARPTAIRKPPNHVWSANPEDQNQQQRPSTFTQASLSDFLSVPPQLRARWFPLKM